MTGKSASLGEHGEEMAARFLEEKGLRIVDRRVRFRCGELDIVARDGAEWVFVEVKTRASRSMGTAAEGMTHRKAVRMLRAVEEYVHLHDLHNARIRCDLIAIDLAADGLPDIRHYPASITMY